MVHSNTHYVCSQHYVCSHTDTSLLQVDCLWDNADAVVSVVQEDMLGDEDEDAAQVAAMQVTAVVDGMPASPMESGTCVCLCVCNYIIHI